MVHRQRIEESAHVDTKLGFCSDTYIELSYVSSLASFNILASLGTEIHAYVPYGESRGTDYQV